MNRKQQANRRNAQNSTGPRTEAGKQTASHNSLRHGFTGRVNILTPENPMECQFAHSIAEDSWRLNGLRAAEANILADSAAWSRNEVDEAVSTARAYLKDAKELQLLSLYEQRINRAIHKNLAALKALQNERAEARRQALEEAKLLTQLDLLNVANARQTADPGQPLPAPRFDQTREIVAGGFVFSNTEINTAIDRDNRLKQARDLNSAPAAPPKRRLALAA